MRARRIGTLLIAPGLIGACALIGPVTDPDMSGARREACARTAAAAATAAAQCFTMTLDGAPADLSAGPLRIAAGSELIALPSGARGCAGRFSHFVLTGSAPAGGAMRISVHDALARGDAARRFEWQRPVPHRNWAVAGIDDPLLTPSTVRLRVERGEVLAESLCLKGY